MSLKHFYEIFLRLFFRVLVNKCIFLKDIFLILLGHLNSGPSYEVQTSFLKLTIIVQNIEFLKINRQYV